jgi:hypothetical protein
VTPASSPSTSHLRTAARLKVEAAAVRITGAFSDEGVPSVVLKGPSFAHWLYDPPDARPHGDLDILIGSGDIQRAEAILTGLGYRYTPIDRPPGSGVEPPPPGAIAGDAIGHGRDWSVEGGVPVDLHFTIPGAGVDPASSWSVLVEHREEMSLAGGTVPVLNEPARAMHVALHAFQHPQGLEHVAIDLDLAIARLSDAVWWEALTLARRLDAEAAFAGGLRTTAEGIALADRLKARSEQSVAEALRDSGAPHEALYVDHVAKVPGVRGKVGLVARKFFPPPDYLRSVDPRARGGTSGLALAYLMRVVRLSVSGARGVIAWRRVRRRG